MTRDPNRFDGAVTDILEGRYGSFEQYRSSREHPRSSLYETSIQIAKCLFQKINSEVFPPITKIELFITSNCPLRCDYCFVSESSAMPMSFETARKAVDFLIRESRGAKELNILFFGGEPLTEPELLKSIVAYAQSRTTEEKREIHFDLTTNGVLLNEDMLRFLATHRIKFLLSIDGAKKSHDKHRRFPNGRGSLGHLERNIPLFKRYQPWLGARMTVHPDTAGDLKDNVDFLISLGINQFLISPAEGIDWSEDNIALYGKSFKKAVALIRKRRKEGLHIRFKPLEDILADKHGNKGRMWGCRAGRHSITIMPDESIYPCSKLVGLPDLADACQLGTLDDGITNIALRLELNDIGVLRNTCKKCDVKDLCMGGCYYNNFVETGHLFGVSTRHECRFVKGFSKVVHHVKGEREKTPQPIENGG